MRKKLIIGYIFTLIIGSFIYISFRTDSLLMYKWFENLQLVNIVLQLREVTLPYKVHFANWFLYSLPDGLWLFSFVTFTLYIWDNKLSMHNVFWITIVPSIAIISEFGQLFKIVPGTFDITDLTFYILGSLIPLIIFNTNNKFKTTNL